MQKAVHPEARPAELPAKLVLYDGVCALCNRSVKLLLHADRQRAFHYAPLQGTTAARLRELHPEIPDDLDTVVLVENGRVWLRSRAFVRAARSLPYPWRILSWLWFVPGFLGDIPYRLIARLRYHLFGKYDACPLPPASVRDLFLP